MSRFEPLAAANSHSPLGAAGHAVPAVDWTTIVASGGARYIGRVGALAVALGIGVAIAYSSAVAQADTPDKDSSSPASSSSNTDSATKGTAEAAARSASTRTPTTTIATMISNAAQSESSKTELTSRVDPHPGVVTASGGAKTTVTGSAGSARTGSTKPPGVPAIDRRTRQGENPTGGATLDNSENGPAASAPALPIARSAAAQALSGFNGPGSIAAMTASARQVSVRTTPVGALAGPAASAPATNPITAVLAGVVQWITGFSHATNNPVSPPHAPTFGALLAWVGREIQYTLFNSSPTINYVKQTDTSQTFDGVIVGDLNVSDAEGDQLTVTVTRNPSKGTVVVSPDGKFVYTPTAQNAYDGVTDSFRVTVDDRPGNPPHINVLSLLAPNCGATVAMTIEVTVQPTSPLGTPDQIATEKMATQILATPEVQQAMAALKVKWLAAAQQQLASVGGPDEVNEALLDAAIRELAFAGALNMQNQNPNDPKVLQGQVPPHNWYGETFSGARVAYDNPDTIYRTIPVNAASSYVLTGQFLGGRPQDINFSVINAANQSVANLSGHDLQVAPDGSFTITVDSLPAGPGQTNHIQLPTGSVQFIVRNTLSDWNTQSPMSLSVERVSGPPNLAPPLTVDQLANATVAFMNNVFPSAIIGYLKVATIDPTTGQLRPPNVLPQPNVLGGLTLETQANSFGYFQLADNQALVITIDPGRAGYFVVPVTNDWEITNDYSSQQTSLNNAQATPNPDGTYTIVLSPTDPGVANWVSTGIVTVNGQPAVVHQGLLQIRFQDFDASSQANPTLSAQVVTLDQLSTVLPADTAYVTPAQRAEQLTDRREAFDNRFAPFTQV